jgi:hypothetical protein
MRKNSEVGLTHLQNGIGIQVS